MPREPVTDALSPDAVTRTFDVLANRTRRDVLRGLRRGDIETLDDAVAEIADPDRGVEIELVHVHLPKLDDGGYVTWDEATGTIEPGPRFEVVDRVLVAVDDG